MRYGEKQKENLPGVSKVVGQLVKVVEVGRGDVGVGRVVAQRKIAGQHPGQVEGGVVEGARVVSGAVQRSPLPVSTRTSLERPLVVEQAVQECVAPHGGRLAPDDLKAGCDGIRTNASVVSAEPSKLLVFDVGALGGCTNSVTRASTVGFAYGCLLLANDLSFRGLARELQSIMRTKRPTKGVTTSNQGHRLRVVHAHTAKGSPNINGSGHGIGDTVRANGVDVNQAHVGVGQRHLQLLSPFVDVGAAIVALVVALREPLRLRAPVDALVRLPGVDTTTAKAQRRETHRLEGHVSGEHHQVGP